MRFDAAIHTEPAVGENAATEQLNRGPRPPAFHLTISRKTKNMGNWKWLEKASYPAVSSMQNRGMIGRNIRRSNESECKKWIGSGDSGGPARRNRRPIRNARSEHPNTKRNIFVDEQDSEEQDW
jgi:hypothetical protein